MYKRSSRLKLRFPYRGQISDEDLWDLPVGELDKLHQQLTARQESTKGKSLLKKKSAEDEVLQLQIDIVTDVVETKLAEARKLAERVSRKQQKDRIREILAKKQDQSLMDMSEEDLLKKLQEGGEDDE
jgi:hypothetical protein